jgi:tetratricopeptide (TPR) repeat protein
MVVRGKTAELVYACGHALIELGRPADALACIDEVLTRMPDDAQLLFVSCVALDLLHLHDELLKRADRLLALDRDSVGAWLGRGNALLGLRRHDEAVRAYDEALARAGDFDALRNRAGALRTLGACEDALADYDRALAARGRRSAVQSRDRAAVARPLRRRARELRGRRRRARQHRAGALHARDRASNSATTRVRSPISRWPAGTTRITASPAVPTHSAVC